MANPVLRGFRRLPFLSLLKKPLPSASYRTNLGTPESFFYYSRLVTQNNLTSKNPIWEYRSFSHGSVNFVITKDGKPKFETHEVEAPKKEKWKTKKRLKLQRKRDK